MKAGGCCSGSLRSRFLWKLGRCPRCMRLALRGTVAGWAVTLVLLLLWPQPLALIPALLWTASFSVLMLAHVTTFTVRALATPRAPAVNAAADPAMEQTASRRQFFGRAATASSAAVLLALFGRQSLVQAFPKPPCGTVSITVTAEEANCAGAMAALEARYARECEKACASQECPGEQRCHPGGWAFPAVRFKDVCCEEQENGDVKAIGVAPCLCTCEGRGVPGPL